MERLREKYYKETNLTARQMSLLHHIRKVFPFLADLAHGQLKAYVQSRDKMQFFIIAQERPHTVYMPGGQEGRKIVPVIEEPLVQDTFLTGQPGRGKREWNYGSMVDMYTFGIHDGQKVICVVSFEVDGEGLGIQYYPRLLEAVVDVMRFARRPVYFPYGAISANDGILVTDNRNRIVFANMEAGRIYRILGVGNLIGCHLFDRQLSQHVMRETVECDRPWEKELTAGGLTLIRRDLRLDEGGQLVRHIVLITDVTQTRAKDEEIRIKSAVIQEIHHRVKNNLQTIASLLRLQARRSKSEEVKAALRESVDRVLSISVVHEFLSQQGEEDIDVQEVMRQIFRLVANNMVDATFTIHTEFSGPELILPSRYASSLALVLNELVLNAMEHAFTGRSSGTIGLAVETSDTELLLDFYDDGIGLPDGFKMKGRKSLGLSIVQTLVEGDLGGSFALENDPRGKGFGTHARIVLSRAEVEQEGDR